MHKLEGGALPWLRGLSQRFQEELEGLAEGSGIPLELLAQWSFIEECEKRGCSGAVILVDGQAWVARNNDTYVPELWGYVAVKELTGRIPTIAFTMEGDVFTPTGINRERLWLHYNFLEVLGRTLARQTPPVGLRLADRSPGDLLEYPGSGGFPG